MIFLCAKQFFQQQIWLQFYEFLKSPSFLKPTFVTQLFFKCIQLSWNGAEQKCAQQNLITAELSKVVLFCLVFIYFMNLYWWICKYAKCPAITITHDHIHDHLLVALKCQFKLNRSQQSDLLIDRFTYTGWSEWDHHTHRQTWATKDLKNKDTCSVCLVALKHKKQQLVFEMSNSFHVTPRDYFDRFQQLNVYAVELMYIFRENNLSLNKKYMVIEKLLLVNIW